MMPQVPPRSCGPVHSEGQKLMEDSIVEIFVEMTHREKWKHLTGVVGIGR